MKRAVIIAGAVLGAVVLFLFQQTTAVTDPYVVKPIVVLPAPSDARTGHTVDIATRTLSVVSPKEVVVIADRGASFSHEVLWIVEVPNKDGSNNLMLYRVELPKFAAADHIRPLGSDLPPKIAKLASGGQWR